MKKITAYYSDHESAKVMAFNLAQSYNFEENITLDCADSQKFSLFNYSLPATIIGALLGSVLGISATLIPNMTLFSYIAPLSGLISGTTIGAICGCIIDYLNYKDFPQCSYITLFVKDDDAGSVLRKLRMHGAVKIVLS